MSSSRPATSTDITLAMAKVFLALPPRKGKAEEIIVAYEAALTGCSKEALDVTVMRLIRGEFDDKEMSRTFAPTPPELANQVRKVERQIDELARLKALPAPTASDYLDPIERYQAKKDELWQRGLMEIARADSHAQAVSMAKKHEVPVGALYIGLLGAFYAPPPRERHDDADGQSPEPGISPDGHAEDDREPIDEEGLDRIDDDDRGLGEYQEPAGATQA